MSKYDHIRNLKITTKPMIFIDFIEGNPNGAGYLPNHPAAHACFYYYICAERARIEADKPIDQQVVLEGEAWNYKHYAQQRESISLIYGVTQDEMDKYWSAVKLVALAIGWPAPKEEYIKAARFRAN